jgi:hypothetical protein
VFFRRQYEELEKLDSTLDVLYRLVLNIHRSQAYLVMSVDGFNSILAEMLLEGIRASMHSPTPWAGASWTGLVLKVTSDYPIQKSRLRAGGKCRVDEFPSDLHYATIDTVYGTLTTSAIVECWARIAEIYAASPVMELTDLNDDSYLWPYFLFLEVAGRTPKIDKESADFVATFCAACYVALDPPSRVTSSLSCF